MRLASNVGLAGALLLASCSSAPGESGVKQSSVEAAATSRAAAPGNATTGGQSGGTTSGALALAITRASYGLVSAQTAPDASCTASAKLPSGRDSTASGLDTHKADSSGNITWRYQTASNTTKGTGTYTVKCTSAGQTKTVTATFTVQ